MGKLLYKSKGIGKKAITAKIVSIVISLIVGVALISAAGSKVQGDPHETLIIGGLNGVRVSGSVFQEYRFDKETRQVLEYAGFFVFIWAIVDVGSLVLHQSCWTEIYEDRIKAKYMGKTLTYDVANITSVSESPNKIKISGTAGTITVVVDDYKKAGSILKSFILK